MDLTVRQLAKRVLPLAPDGDLDTVSRQLRHWTMQGVVRPTGSIHSGAGKARKYPETEIYFAALALEVARWRIPVGMSEGILQAARKEFEGDVNPTKERKTFIADAIAGKQGIFLFLKYADRADSHQVEFKIGLYEDLVRAVADARWTMGTPSFLAIDLSSLFGSIGS
jgi:hypothetical protein